MGPRPIISFNIYVEWTFKRFEVIPFLNDMGHSALENTPTLETKHMHESASTELNTRQYISLAVTNDDVFVMGNIRTTQLMCD